MQWKTTADSAPRARRGRDWALALALAVAAAFAPACASDDAATKGDSAEPTTGDVKADAAPAAEAGDDGDDSDDPVLAPPKTWADVAVRYEYVCPTPWFELETPAEFPAGEKTIVIEGSRARLDPPLGDRVTFGILGALKDAAPKTRKNVRKAMKKFRAANVDIVVANGDLAEDEGIREVLVMLGEEVELPTMVHAGNIEWAGAFSPAFADIHPKFPQLINGNWVRVLDLGMYALVTIPGYWNLKFIRQGACRYPPEETERLLPIVKGLADEGKTVVLTAHGPPKMEGRKALDVTYDYENVGDPNVTTLIEDGDIRFGLFSHILEAGGRATKDLSSERPLERPQLEPTDHLYINAGSASSYPWEMLSKHKSYGIAAIVTIESGAAKVDFISLSKKNKFLKKKKKKSRRGKKKKKKKRRRKKRRRR